MTESDSSYFEYLKTRSRLAAGYRRCMLYPRLARRLRGRTLDIGCGIGDMLAHRAQTVGVDINPQTVAYCRSIGLDAHIMRIDQLPFDSMTFESALMDNVIEHIAEPRPLLAETRRVLVSGGRLLIGVPGRRGWDSDPDHKVFYDEPSLRAAVEPNGFEHMETFAAPLVRSQWLAERLRQYCVYALFART